MAKFLYCVPEEKPLNSTIFVPFSQKHTFANQHHEDQLSVEHY